MANIKGFKFFDFDSTNEISNILTNPSRGESLTIEVNDNGTGIGLSLVVQGKSDLQDEENWFNIAAISLADYSISPKIEKAGLYVIPRFICILPSESLYSNISVSPFLLPC